jgi:hypothetical protein
MTTLSWCSLEKMCARSEKSEEYSGKEMQRVMEVYNLSMDIDAQVETDVRVWNF